MTNKRLYACYFMIPFFAFAAITGSLCLWSSLKDMQWPSDVNSLNGEWTTSYEKTFDKKIFFQETSTQLWGMINYTLFKNGRDGVLIGDNGWLFTTEEFTYFPDAKKETQAKIDYIQKVKNVFDDRGIALIVALIPAKARVYKEHLGRYRFPSYNDKNYQNFRQNLKENNVAVTDLLIKMKQNKVENEIFLRTDTHWTTEGAKMSAHVIKSEIEKSLPGLKLEKTTFYTEKVDEIERHGDLMSYIPLGTMKLPDLLQIDWKLWKQNYPGKVKSHRLRTRFSGTIRSRWLWSEPVTAPIPCGILTGS